jgi:hypothetical protein
VGRTVEAQGIAGLAGMGRDGQEQMLGRDVAVAQLAHLLLGVAQDLDELTGGRCILVTLTAHRRKRVECVVRRAPNRRRLYSELSQKRQDDPVLLLEQHGEQVLRRRLRVVALVGQPLCGLKRLLGFDREAVWLHSVPVVVRMEQI